MFNKRKNFRKTYSGFFNCPDLEKLKYIPYKAYRQGQTKVLCSHITGHYGIYYFDYEEQKWVLNYELQSKHYACYDLKSENRNYVVKRIK